MQEEKVDLRQRDNIRRITAEFVKNIDITGRVQSYGTPLVILDMNMIRHQYRSLQGAFPSVDFYFALKSIEQPAAVDVIAGCGGFIDVATKGEIDLVLSRDFPIEKCMHTHPIKKPSDIDYAYGLGIKRFVVDNLSELEKFKNRPSDIEIMLRLGHSDPGATVNLSYKFGASDGVAKQIVSRAIDYGINIVGICMHVGSQVDDITSYTRAIKKTVSLIDEIEAANSIKIKIIDIGGGFPVSYRRNSPDINEISKTIKPILDPLIGRFKIIAEPGRFISASAGINITTIVSKTTRDASNWLYIDDGLYGAYATSQYEPTWLHFFNLKELLTDEPNRLEPTTIAGPTCDSVDVMTKDYPFPDSKEGEIVISPMTGAYFTTHMTNFNLLPRTKIIVIDSRKDT